MVISNYGKKPTHSNINIITDFKKYLQLYTYKFLLHLLSCDMASDASAHKMSHDFHHLGEINYLGLIHCLSDKNPQSHLLTYN